MGEMEQSNFDKLVAQIEAKTGTGSDALAERDPQIPWGKAGDLVDEEITIVDYDEREGMDGKPAFACRVITKDHVLLRVTFGGNAVRHKLEAVKDLLPLKFTLVERKGKKSGMRYFDLE